MIGSGSQDSEETIESKVSWDLVGLNHCDSRIFHQRQKNPSKAKDLVPSMNQQAQKDLETYAVPQWV